mmetsp:Transcript_1469/g.2033  ORF Transcript_1469/g.2033 Transcript_1469/m.2033 type:complete len:170 (-) Transcript_1469:295-804(-)
MSLFSAGGASGTAGAPSSTGGSTSVEGSGSGSGSGSGPVTATPLLTLALGTYDYVCDVRWSPLHPALFSTVSSCGDLALWNLNHSTEEPLLPIKVEGGRPLNKVAWSSVNGRCLAVGDAGGATFVYTLSEEVANPSKDEESKLEQTLREMTKNQILEEDSGQLEEKRNK